MYQLKPGQESFTVVDGPLAGRTFVPLKYYAEIPPQEAGRFVKIKEDKPAKAESGQKATRAATADIQPVSEEVTR